MEKLILVGVGSLGKINLEEYILPLLFILNHFELAVRAQNSSNLVSQLLKSYFFLGKIVNGKDEKRN